MKNNYDVITTTDKAKRDKIFRQMRESTDPLERASVKYSGNEIVPDEFGEGGSDGKFIHYRVSGSKPNRFVEFRNKQGENMFVAVALILLLVAVGMLAHRVVLLEARCNAQCLYGDKDCAARCAKAGHCPFQKD